MRHRQAKMVQRIPGLSIESDAVVVLLDMLESNRSEAKKIYDKAWDAMAGGGKKKALVVLTPETTKFVRQHWDEFANKFSDMHLFDFNDPRAQKMVGKVMAVGLLNDMVETPLQYAKYMSSQAKQEIEEAVVERGKAKFETMLRNKGLVSSEAVSRDFRARRPAQTRNNRSRIMRRRKRRRRTHNAKSVMAEIDELERQLDASDDSELEQWAEELGKEEASIAERSTGISVEESMDQNERAEKNWPVQAKTAARLLKLASELLDDEL